jgi:hypothetical protein
MISTIATYKKVPAAKAISTLEISMAISPFSTEFKAMPIRYTSYHKP